MWTTGIMTLFEPEKTPFVIQIFNTLNFKSLQNVCDWNSEELVKLLIGGTSWGIVSCFCVYMFGILGQVKFDEG